VLIEETRTALDAGDGVSASNRLGITPPTGRDTPARRGTKHGARFRCPVHPRNAGKATGTFAVAGRPTQSQSGGSEAQELA